MKILWFVNAPFPEMVEYLNLKGNFMGCWMPALKRALLNTDHFESQHKLGIACALPEILKYGKFEKEGISYFCLPKSRLCEYFQSYKKELWWCGRVVEEFKPDIIHVHGTEEFYGLLTGHVPQPVVVSIQGILSAYVRVYFGSMKWMEIPASPRIIRHYLMMKRKTRTEQHIYKINKNFIGRTLWDKSHLMSLTSGECRYYHSDEVMRPEFYQAEWKVEEALAGTIACVSSAYAYKGIDSLLEAVFYLKKRLAKIVLYVYGSFPEKGYGAFLRKKVKKLGLIDNVRFCGFRESQELVQELLKMRAFVIPSHIENSANSLQEAMLLGIPSVVAFAGGLPSLAECGKTALMFPRSDAAVMADCLFKILTDEELAARLSSAGRSRARLINDPHRIAHGMLKIYYDVIHQHNVSVNE